MKKIIILLTAVVTGLGLYSCSDDKLSNTIQTSDKLLLPRNNYPLDLSKDATIVFEWADSKTEDNSYLTYEVLFDAVTGDFSDPVYTVKSDNNGFSPQVELGTSTMLSIVSLVANRIGAVPGESMTFKWTVRVWRGKVSELYSGSGGSRTIVTTSPYPTRLRMQGAGTENQDIMPFSQAGVIHTSTGTYTDQRQEDAYEIFTKLGSGNFDIYDDYGRYYSMDGDGNLILSETRAGNTVTNEGVYWLYANLEDLTYEIKQISKVEFLLYATGDKAELDYVGKGVWSIEEYPWDVSTLGANKDTRHKFICTYADGSQEYWSHFEDDCRTANESESQKPALFYNIFRTTTDVAEDAQCWKTNEPNGEGFLQDVTFTLYMNNTESTKFLYKREFTGDGEMPFPVDHFISPAAGDLVELLNVANITETFSWSRSIETQIITPTYEVVLFSDSDGIREVGRYTANNNGYDTSADIPHTVLDQAAENAGIEDEGTGSLYWSVSTTIYSNSVIATEAPREVVIQRLPGLPEGATISGVAAEGTIELFAASVVYDAKGTYNRDERQSGAYECYTRFTAGDFTVVDDQGRYLVLESDNTISVSASPVNNTATAGIYRFYLDFYTMTWEMDEIISVELWTNPWFNSTGTGYLADLTYDNNGVWKIDDYAWYVGTASQKDTRYHFIATFGDGRKELWGHFEDDCRNNSNPDGTAYFYNVYRFTERLMDSDHWAQSWKTLNDSEGVEQKATFHLYMNNTQDTMFTHTRSFSN